LRLDHVVALTSIWQGRDDKTCVR